VRKKESGLIDNIKLDVDIELDRQRRKWGLQDHDPQMWMNILMVEVGEASKAMMEAVFRGAKKHSYRDEMVQVAAVAISAIENFDRRMNLDEKFQ